MRVDLGPKSCRVCLEPSERLQRIDESREEGEETPNEMLVQLLGIPFSKLNGREQIPENICKPCKVELNMAYQFREKALRKQIEIEEYCRHIGIWDDVDDVLVKEEGHTYSTQEDDEMENLEYDETVVNDSKGEEYLEVDSNEQQETITGDIEYLDENYIEIDPDQEEVVLESTINSPSRLIRSRQIAIKQKLKSRRSRKLPNFVQTTYGEKGGYICDVCGNFYEKRGRMMEHRRRHDSVCQYQCELCEEKFQVREQLRKHMYSHTGSKPFKCSYCSRQFFYESVLKAHENVHRGVKPYVCKVCDKAFAYAHSLTKHELIHSDIKQYHCSYCKKDFRLLHHMRQHEETKCHINAVLLHQNMRYSDYREEEEEQEVELVAEEDLNADDRKNFAM